MRKIIISLGALSLILIIVAIATQISYSNLGYTMETTIIKEPLELNNCFSYDVFATPTSIKSRVASETKKRTEGIEEVGKVTLKIIPEESRACWYVDVNKTSKVNNIIYTDKTILDKLNDDSYNIKDEKWVKTDVIKEDE